MKKMIPDRANDGLPLSLVLAEQSSQCTPLAQTLQIPL